MSFESSPNRERVSSHKPAKFVRIGEHIRCADGVVRSVTQMIGEEDNQVRIILSDNHEFTVSNEEAVETVPLR